MSGLTPIDPQTYRKFLEYMGCKYKRPEKGDHVVWGKGGLKRPIIFPNDIVSRTVITTNNRTLGISTKEYLEILAKL